MVDRAAQQFTSVNFILAHAPIAFAEECAMLCRFRPNVWLDLSGFQVTLEWDPSLRSVERLVTCGLNHRILFGTDWPAFRLQGTQRMFVDALVGGPLRSLPASDRDLILRGNAERLLAPVEVGIGQ